MKIETYLNAMRKALIQRECFVAFTPMWHKRYQQADSFHAQILRMFKEQEELREIDRKIFMDIDQKLVALNLDGLWTLNE